MTTAGTVAAAKDHHHRDPHRKFGDVETTRNASANQVNYTAVGADPGRGHW